MTQSGGTGSPGGEFSYCASCGNELGPDDRFCSECGHEVGTGIDSRSTTGAAPGDGDRRAFRRRVNDYLQDGWEIQYDAGDEVVLVDRGFGSIGIHVLLFLFTSGFGNLLYGWYHYTKKAERIVVRAGEDTEPLNAPGQGPAPSHDTTDEQSSLGSYVFGLLLLLLGIYVIGTSLASFGGILAGVGLVLVSLLLLPPTRRRLRDRHPPTTFGPTEDVEERAATATDQLCSICRAPVEGDGVVREYGKEYVVAGIPLYTIEAGENWYCDSCHSEYHELDVGQDRFEEPIEESAVETPEPAAAGGDSSEESAGWDSVEEAAVGWDSNEEPAASEDSVEESSVGEYTAEDAAGTDAVDGNTAGDAVGADAAGADAPEEGSVEPELIGEDFVEPEFIDDDTSEGDSAGEGGDSREREHEFE